jgi:hypothetical protein
MSVRKAFPLRISPDLYRELQKWAAADLRSMNGQIEFLLLQAIRRRKRSRGDDPGSGSSAPPDKS